MDKVNHPPHYQGTSLEAIDVIEAFELGFNLGNTIKYVLRAGKKGDAIEDLEKAIWYLEREKKNQSKFAFTGQERAIQINNRKYHDSSNDATANP